MNKRSYYSKKCLLALGFALFTYTSVVAQRPNIIYIMTDDMGYGDLSSYGRKDYITPHLDRLASQGIKFMNAYSAASLCTPTRTAFMTGRYPARTPVGLIEPLTGRSDSIYGLTTEYPSVATLLKIAGYETALIGKWHLGFQPKHNPTKNGFDYFFGIRSGAADYVTHKGHHGKHDLYENESPAYIKGYLTEIFEDKVNSYLKQEHKKPFFLTITFNAPHWPWQGPNDPAYPDTLSQEAGGTPQVYAAMMKSLDDAVGAIMRTLDEQQLAENTLVIFTNDNGGERFSNHAGLAKKKMNLWDGGIKVPAFVRWPGKITPRTVTNQAAITMDWTATILAAAGAKPHPDFPLDGIDLLPVMTGKQKEIERTFYWRNFQRNQQKAIREGNWKYLQDKDGEYLFNPAADPGEKHDLKEKEPATFERLKNKYADWEKTVLVPIPLGK
jgi:arylsulfatase A-like enzyme